MDFTLKAPASGACLTPSTLNVCLHGYDLIRLLYRAITLPNELSVRIEGSTRAISENRMIDLLYYYLSMCKRHNAISHATLHGGSWEKHGAVSVTSVSKRGVAWCSVCVVMYGHPEVESPRV